MAGRKSIGYRGGDVDSREESGVGVAGSMSTKNRRGGVDVLEKGCVGVVGNICISNRGCIGVGVGW